MLRKVESSAWATTPLPGEFLIQTFSMVKPGAVPVRPHVWGKSSPG